MPRKADIDKRKRKRVEGIMSGGPGTPMRGERVAFAYPAVSQSPFGGQTGHFGTGSSSRSSYFPTSSSGYSSASRKSSSPATKGAQLMMKPTPFNQRSLFGNPQQQPHPTHRDMNRNNNKRGGDPFAEISRLEDAPLIDPNQFTNLNFGGQGDISYATDPSSPDFWARQEQRLASEQQGEYKAQSLPAGMERRIEDRNRPPAPPSGPMATAGNMPTDHTPPPEGMNYMEEQFVKYGHDLGNYRPSPIVGTDQMSSVYTDHETMTPAEYGYFFNWQHPIVPGGKKFARNKPTGTAHMYDQTHLHENVLAEMDRKYEFSRVHGGVVQNKTRFDEAPVFLSSY